MSLLLLKPVHYRRENEEEKRTKELWGIMLQTGLDSERQNGGYQRPTKQSVCEMLQLGSSTLASVSSECVDCTGPLNL